MNLFNLLSSLSPSQMSDPSDELRLFKDPLPTLLIIDVTDVDVLLSFSGTFVS